MKVIPAEEAVKRHMLVSLARSQRALTRMIEAVADQVEASQPTRERLAEHIDLISAYQGALIRNMTSLRLHRRRRGKPGPPWLDTRVRAGRGPAPLP